MTQPILKPMAPGDIPALQDIVAETGLFPPEYLPEMVAPALSGETEEVWLVGWLEGAPVGVIYAGPELMTEGTWNIIALGVLPGLQGQGLGAALVGAVEAQARENGGRLMVIDTSGGPDFAGARAFYDRLGYEREARIRDFWAAGDDKVIFRKVL